METRKQVKKIELIESDFNHINMAIVDSEESNEANDQFINIMDCPIARASKRIWDDVLRVSPFSIGFFNGDHIGIDGRMVKVERCRKQLVAGKKAYINVEE